MNLLCHQREGGRVEGRGGRGGMEGDWEGGGREVEEGREGGWGRRRECEREGWR